MFTHALYVTYEILVTSVRTCDAKDCPRWSDISPTNVLHVDTVGLGSGPRMLALLTLVGYFPNQRYSFSKGWAGIPGGPALHVGRIFLRPTFSILNLWGLGSITATFFEG